MDANGRPKTATQQQHQALPSIASLTSNLPPPDQSHSPLHGRQQSDARDSGNWSLSQGPSKHSSTISNNTGLQLQTILNAEDSPSRNSMPETPSSARYPASQVRHVDRRFSPPTEQSKQNALPSLNQGFENRVSTISTDAASSHQESRRSSIDSRMNVGMTHLQISPSSPYESQNVSRVSLVSNLQQQRGVPLDQRPNGASPLSPLGPRANGIAATNGTNGLRSSTITPRRAPVINPNPRSVSGMPDPMAQAPTKGYPWAFPGEAEPEERRGSSSGDSSEHRSISRQNSFAASVNSSVYTHDSGMPMGQKRFDDDMSTTHHHTMQHRSVTNLQANDHSAQSSGGNYSRTPELRVSHKMAERKRRSEMKGLFDELNNILPNSPGSKSSKWEILTKSIEYIKGLQRSHEGANRELQRLRPDADYSQRYREEAENLRQELATCWQSLRRIDPNNPHIYGPTTGMFAQQQSQMPTQNGNQLPPLQAPPQAHGVPAGWAPPPAGAMQGVEFANGRPYEHR